ncbi:MAG: NADH-quinone oxidoreductase subunit NuoE [Gammaproteobacteria bacterium]|nr:NADH-quinone oxidoreductase subunit NuoE [Gammaproteobacteria bacterium]
MSAQEQVNSKLDLLTSASRQEIDHWLAKYPPDQKQSAVMAALRIVQDQNGGWLTEGLMDAVAEYLEMPAIAVYEVATFYSMYELKPVGRHKICVCTNISCMLCKSDSVVSHLQEKLGIKLGETTSDGRITLKEVECLGACVDAPVMQIGNEYFGHLTPEKIDDILDKLE